MGKNRMTAKGNPSRLRRLNSRGVMDVDLASGMRARSKGFLADSKRRGSGGAYDRRREDAAAVARRSRDAEIADAADNSRAARRRRQRRGLR